MFQTVVAVRERVAAVLKAAGLSASVHFVMATGETGRYVVLLSKPSARSRDSLNRIEDVTLEINCCSTDVEEAARMLDAVCDDLDELSADEMVIRGGRLVGCECRQDPSVENVTADAGKMFAGVVAYEFKTETKRKK